MSAEEEKKRTLELAERGARARKFAESDFWVKDLEPMLKTMQDRAMEEALPHHGLQKTVDEVALNASHWGGQFAALEEIVTGIARMVRDGQEAARVLEQAKKKEEGVR